MIGNDLIDFKAASKNSRLLNARFRKKAFTPGEEKFIDESDYPEKTFWTIWSMKEAAYKARQRETNSPPKLNPVKFECFPSDDLKSGIVRAFGKIYHSKTQFSKIYIHSIASAEDNIQFFLKFYSKNSDYKARFSSLISRKFLPGIEISVEKNTFKIPSFHLKDSTGTLPVSISHDGNLAALVFPLIKS
ncbi:hypothetical protein C7S20_14440 [Christiangramia fulva]|uniref:4'-phosphopantetheinyl transferase domain-containing protein n=1 Tax=Christiangramia fulva TaxID=2126553 RepID=A0A2R3Z7X3_9FLAO|nr:4'-phosphopantetheinyl transferase superfamily protein [Christiangramia fulva]AVR46366.1 hypothetical protein C7S20_14440 [Christiangramia fulva]